MENMYVEIGGAIVLVLTNLAAYLKARSDVKAIRDDREATKETRDKDSQELHDAVMKHGWDIQNLKDMSGHRDQVIEQLQQQISILNSTMATTNVKLDTLVDAIKELKDR